MVMAACFFLYALWFGLKRNLRHYRESLLRHSREGLLRHSREGLLRHSREGENSTPSSVIPAKAGIHNSRARGN